MVTGAKSPSEAKHIHGVFYGEQDFESCCATPTPTIDGSRGIAAYSKALSLRKASWAGGTWHRRGIAGGMADVVKDDLILRHLVENEIRAGGDDQGRMVGSSVRVPIKGCVGKRSMKDLMRD
jgi:hypothetical protein